MAGRSDPRETRLDDDKLKRLDTAQALFHAWINRTEAYDYAHLIGLTLFSSSVQNKVKFTPLFSPFRKHVDDAHAKGATRLYDALSTASDELEQVRTKHADCILRVVVLSDGQDTESGASLPNVAARLLRMNVVVDAVCIGDDELSSFAELAGLSIASGGYCFRPESLREALRLNELEPVLSYRQRMQHPRPRWDGTTHGLKGLFRGRGFYTVEETEAPEEVQLSEAVVPANVAVDGEEVWGAAGADQDAAPGDGAAVDGDAAVSPLGHRPRESCRRIMSELRGTLKEPHPNFAIFPSSEDLGFWQVVLSAPTEGPYAHGCWLLWIRFPHSFPDTPPEVRFKTPILHCNINSTGRVCHSILDRNWTPDTSVKRIFDCVYGLLLNPDVEDPLDSNLALDSYDDSGTYQVRIVEHTKAHASTPPEVLSAQMLLQTLSPAERVAEAETSKHAGNELYKKGAFEASIRHYKAGLEYLEMEVSDAPGSDDGDDSSEGGAGAGDPARAAKTSTADRAKFDLAAPIAFNFSDGDGSHVFGSGTADGGEQGAGEQGAGAGAGASPGAGAGDLADQLDADADADATGTGATMITEELLKARKNVLLTNMTMAYGKALDYHEAIKCATQVLVISGDANNIKALYWRASAFENLGELASAKRDFRRASKSGCKRSARGLKRVKASLDEEIKKETEMYKRAFQNLF